MNADAFFQAVWSQDADALRNFFAPDAYVNWHSTNEHFTAAEFIQANCEYPGEWEGEIERVETSGDLTIVAAHVYTKDRSHSFHCVSFIRAQAGKIISMDEYWGDDGPAPQWRLDKQIGVPIIRKGT